MLKKLCNKSGSALFVHELTPTTVLELGYAHKTRVDVENLFDSAYSLPLGGVSLGDYDATGLLRPVPGRGRSINLGLSTQF